MQRLLRIKNIVPSSEFRENLGAELDLLKRHAPSSIHQMYAHPYLVVQGSDFHLDWLSPVSGIITPYTELAAKERTFFDNELNKALHYLRALQAELLNRARTTEAAKLSILLAKPKAEQLYSINNKLVIAQWKTPSLSHQTSFQENYADVAHLIPPPDFAIVLDTSGSMDTCTTFSPDEIQRLNQHLQQQIDTGKLDSTAAIQQFIHSTHKEPSRITLAKKAIQQLLPHLHANILIHFYSFDGNDSPHYHGLYPVTHRQALIDTIQQLQASGGTPLINTLIEASNTMDGVNNDALILCFIDGDDNSNWILSEFVQQLKASKPRLRINIVDISQEGSMDLLALETGGRVYKSHKPKQIIKDILQSTNEIAAKPKKK